MRFKSPSIFFLLAICVLFLMHATSRAGGRIVVRTRGPVMSALFGSKTVVRDVGGHGGASVDLNVQRGFGSYGGANVNLNVQRNFSGYDGPAAFFAPSRTIYVPVPSTSFQLNVQRSAGVYSYGSSGVQLNAGGCGYSGVSSTLRGLGTCGGQVVEESQTVTNADGSKQETFRRLVR